MATLSSLSVSTARNVYTEAAEGGPIHFLWPMSTGRGTTVQFQ
jgi:hypothetical protein